MAPAVVFQAIALLAFLGMMKPVRVEPLSGLIQNVLAVRSIVELLVQRRVAGRMHRPDR